MDGESQRLLCLCVCSLTTRSLANSPCIFSLNPLVCRCVCLCHHTSHCMNCHAIEMIGKQLPSVGIPTASLFSRLLSVGLLQSRSFLTRPPPERQRLCACVRGSSALLASSKPLVFTAWQAVHPLSQSLHDTAAANSVTGSKGASGVSGSSLSVSVMQCLTFTAWSRSMSGSREGRRLQVKQTACHRSKR